MRLSVPWTALVFLLVQGVLPAYTGTITKPTRNWGCDAFPILPNPHALQIHPLYLFPTVKKIGNNMGRFANATLVRLSEFLSAGYKKGVRPVKDWRDSTSVAIDLMIYSILNVVSYYLFMMLLLLHVNVSELCLVRPTTLGSISIKCLALMDTHTNTL